MAESKNILNTTILHEDFTLSTDQPIEKLEAIVKHVETRMNEIYAKFPIASYKKIAVLAALNIAEELFLAREECDRAHELSLEGSPEVMARTDELIRKLEAL